jgi:anti-sigma factor RsiW
MTPKADFFGRIEDYCLDLLDAQEKKEFEQELKVNAKLREEVELHKNIQAAVLEMDILNLKGKLEEIQEETDYKETSSETFKLLEDLEEFEEAKEELTFEELIDTFESLPKVHVYQHERTQNENIHQYYNEQNGVEASGLEEDLNGFDVEGLEGLEEAVLETDILNLRESLGQIAQSVEPQFSVEDIDDFLSGEMGDDILAEFEAEFDNNEGLQEEVNLHKDIESSLHENDIMNLRAEMKDIMESETSWNVSEQNIEDFIDGILEEDLLEEFNAELEVNTDLMAEVSLREHINEAVGETDIQDLRASLSNARNEAEKNDMKSIVMPKTDRSLKFWRNSAAMIIVLIGLAGVLNNGFQSVDSTYNKYFETPTWASERSVSTSLDNIQTAKVYFQKSDFNAVIQLLDKTNVKDDEAFVTQFYKGLSYQNLNNFAPAINEYTQVIKHGNNLFVEEAEWYRSLCYLKMNKEAEAKQELLAVIDRKGHYQSEAKAILRKLRYSLK